MPKLTPKQAAFAREYLVDRNATQAAIRAGYSAKTAVSGRLLAVKFDVKVGAELAENAGEAESAPSESQIDVDWVLNRLSAEAELEKNGGTARNSAPRSSSASTSACSRTAWSSASRSCRRRSC